MNDLTLQEQILKNEGTLDRPWRRYVTYIKYCDDGQGRDIRTECRTHLKTFNKWLNNEPGNPVEESK